MPSLDKKMIRRSTRRDRVARWIITLGGMAIIASVITILLLMVGVTFPLFQPASIRLEKEVVPATTRAVGEKIVAAGVKMETDEHDRLKLLTANLLGRDGAFFCYDLMSLENNISNRQKIDPPGEKNASILSVERHGGSQFTLLWSDGGVSLVNVTTTKRIDDVGKTIADCQASTIASDVAPYNTGITDPKTETVKAVARRVQEDDGTTKTTFLRLQADNTLTVVRQIREVNELLGTDEQKSFRSEIGGEMPGAITSLTLDNAGTQLFAATDNGCLIAWRIDDEAKATRLEMIRAFPDHRAISAIGFIYGDGSLAVGDALGGVSIWSFVRNAEGERRLRMLHDFPSVAVRSEEKSGRAIVEIIPSTQKKTFLIRDAFGAVKLFYPTSERKLAEMAGTGKISVLGVDSRCTVVGILDDKNLLSVYRIDAPHPEVSLHALFGKVFYEGYDEPEYAWQTTGSQDSEPKLSLVPLIFGTMKGTFYAMLFAVPLSILGAIYTSHFTTARLKKTIKPVVEIMAAVPSVVIGFLAALWFAPLLNRWILGCFASLAVIPLYFLLFMLLWRHIRRFDWAKRIETGYEFLAITPVIFLGVATGMYLVSDPMRTTFGGNLETWLFGGDFVAWINHTLHLSYDQRNCVVIAFALGFAAVPIIFSIAEDSLSNVPHSMTAASLAMGASRWQTVWRVVLPSAAPGIFAGTMIGFGRVVGETMIVLMATGNTPILDVNPFNGMRTLSANIAVEIPEAPVGGTLYRVLFLCAVLLFIMTFFINTAAELVRSNLRKKYGKF